MSITENIFEAMDYIEERRNSGNKKEDAIILEHIRKNIERICKLATLALEKGKMSVEAFQRFCDKIPEFFEEFTLGSGKLGVRAVALDYLNNYRNEKTINDNELAAGAVYR